MFRRNVGSEAVLKVRCSQGLRPSLYYGACSNRSGQDVDLPLIDSDKSITVSLVRPCRAALMYVCFSELPETWTVLPSLSAEWRCGLDLIWGWAVMRRVMLFRFTMVRP